MFTCRNCYHQSEMFEVYKHVPQRWCVHCLQESYELDSWHFTGHLINCILLNKKRCPELRKLLSQKLWVAPTNIKGTRTPGIKIPRTTLLEMWKRSLWDTSHSLILDELGRAHGNRAKRIAGIAKVLGIPLVEYYDDATLELLRPGRFRAPKLLQA